MHRTHEEVGIEPPNRIAFKSFVEFCLPFIPVSPFPISIGLGHFPSQGTTFYALCGWLVADKFVKEIEWDFLQLLFWGGAIKPKFFLTQDCLLCRCPVRRVAWLDQQTPYRIWTGNPERGVPVVVTLLPDRTH